MPGQTTNLGLRYPLINETVDAASFQNLANDIDGAVTTIQALRQLVTNRTRVSATVPSPGQSVPISTATNLLFTAQAFASPSNFHSTTTNTDQFVVQYNGLYLVMGTVIANPSTLPTGATSLMATISLNGTNQYWSLRAINRPVGGLPSPTVTGLLLCTAGDIIRMSTTWTGGTGPANLQAGLDIAQLAYV